MKAVRKKKRAGESFVLNHLALTWRTGREGRRWEAASWRRRRRRKQNKNLKAIEQLDALVRYGRGTQTIIKDEEEEKTRSPLHNTYKGGSHQATWHACGVTQEQRLRPPPPPRLVYIFPQIWFNPYTCVRSVCVYTRPTPQQSAPASAQFHRLKIFCVKCFLTISKRRPCRGNRKY